LASLKKIKRFDLFILKENCAQQINRIRTWNDHHQTHPVEEERKKKKTVNALHFLSLSVCSVKKKKNVKIKW
jgi:hypothetical protein